MILEFGSDFMDMTRKAQVTKEKNSVTHGQSPPCLRNRTIPNTGEALGCTPLPFPPGKNL